MIFYYLKKNKIEKYEVPGRGFKFFLFPPKIGIISHTDLVFLKRRYPFQAKKILKQVIQEDLSTLFPQEKYDFYYEMIQETPSEIEVNLWIYEKILKDRLLQEGCTALLLEPLIYVSKEPTLFLFKEENIVFIYTQEEKIFNYSTLPFLNKENLELLLKSSKPHSSTKWIIYGDIDEKLKEYISNISKNSVLEIRELPNYPIFLDFVNLKKVKPIRLKTLKLEKLDWAFLCRLIIYFFLGISLNFYLSIKAYEKEITKLEERIQSLTKAENTSINTPIENKLMELRQKKQDPLYILNSLSKLLPQGSYINKFNLSEETLELSISTSDPLITLNNLYFENCFTSIKLASTIQKEEGNYQIELKIGLKECKLTENI